MKSPRTTSQMPNNLSSSFDTKNHNAYAERGKLITCVMAANSILPVAKTNPSVTQTQQYVRMVKNTIGATDPTSAITVKFFVNNSG